MVFAEVGRLTDGNNRTAFDEVFNETIEAVPFALVVKLKAC
jgi:hypothetical protein